MTPLVTTSTQGASYVEWGAVFAGSVLACAVSLVLLQFGGALGLSIDQTLHRTSISWGPMLTVQLWLLWVQLMASMAGGYMAGRMRGPWGNPGHESEVRDGAHGLLVWATSLLMAAVGASIAAYLGMLAVRNGAVNPDATIAPDALHRSGIILGFGMVASSIVSGLAAWGMGVVGGDHRDKGIDATQYISFRKKIG